ncbi:hypothetical protein, partial [Aeromonas veronii]|uniref:hypothetical protein n=1 Tax=Aeromonas veronii TaxID=654 RepID=UPI003D1EBF9E
VSMMVDLKVMAYFKISLSTRNWDRALKKPAHRAGFLHSAMQPIPCPANSFSTIRQWRKALFP